jgi:hypothetical protein
MPASDASKVIMFPARGPFAVHILRDRQCWLVVCRNHGWAHGNKRDAIANANDLARGFDVAVVVEV